MPFPTFTRLRYFFDDFDWFNSITASAVGPGTKWTSVTEMESFLLMLDGDGGQIRLSGGSATNEFALVYQQTETFTIETGKKMWFGIRAKMTGTTIAKGIFEFGLGQHDADPLSVTDSDRMQFIKPGTHAAANTDLHFKIIAGSTAVAEALAIDTAVSGEFHAYEWEFDGVSNFAYYIDGVHVGTLSTTSFPTTEMGIYMACAPGSDNAAIGTCPQLDIDWVYCAKQRVTTND
jgi:hypothetical protein